MRRRYIGAHGRLGGWQQLCEARNLPAPYVKKFKTHQQCEERPESGTWQQSVGDGDSSNGRPLQQHEGAVYRGPWQIRGLAAAM
ncbi:unnamed protein product [Staurois parvus]|uniref:Uncharacterized protein n=1 Tax=Staurois parvus TaxID=386267 RepID=A0ABN9CYV8_9NEOB|nr:unnamed protein product [Staurois parvus]